jgi:hypothetical protein
MLATGFIGRFLVLLAIFYRETRFFGTNPGLTPEDVSNRVYRQISGSFGNILPRNPVF